MAKQRSGYVFQENGRWFARVTFTGEDGKRRNVKRRVANKTEAKELIKQINRELDDHGQRTMQSANMTFASLAAYYEEHYLVEAEYVDGRKIRGRRSLKGKGLKAQLRALQDFFGRKKLRGITYGDLNAYRGLRLKTPIISQKKKLHKQRSIASVNREMALLRNMLNVALHEGWIIKNPFASGKPLINLADERKRERILTREEEVRLLEVCTGLRARLRPIIICALDTGMRQGEMLKLKWKDVDLSERIITVQAFNTKTMRERQIAMTERLAGELLQLWDKSIKDADDLVFGFKNNIKKSFTTARKLTGLEDVRFHDLRHTHASRLVSAHIPLSEVGRVLGHTQANTTYRYVNANVETVRRAAAALDAFHRTESEVIEPQSERIN